MEIKFCFKDTNKLIMYFILPCTTLDQVTPEKPAKKLHAKLTFIKHFSGYIVGFCLAFLFCLC